MKLIKYTVAAMIALAAGSASAFHSGGVAECNGCHTMHNSLEGAVMAKNATGLGQYQSGPYLLIGNDQSSACLNCHASDSTRTTGYYVATKTAPAAGLPPIQYTPGGDFTWLKKTYTWSPRSGTTETSPGDRKGHNVIAADFGFAVDATFAGKTSPGGSFPANNLGCQSCHDPHGKFRRLADGSVVNGKTTSLPIRGSGSYATSADPIAGIYAVGTYRILAGQGYSPKSLAGAHTFSNTEVPVAVAQSAYNQAEGTALNRVAYGQNMSEWCGNCHASMHRTGYTSGTSKLTHPSANAEKLDSFIIDNYNAYVKTGDLAGANATAYNTLVPFESGTNDYAVLKGLAGNVTTGPTVDSNVSCMSCHRAHASGFDSMLRWSMHYEFITDGDATGVPSYGDPTAPPGTKTAVAQGRTVAETTAAYYGRDATKFAPYQRVLCNKCHVKD